MKEFRAIRRIVKLRNLTKTYEKLLATAKYANVKVFNERKFFEYFSSEIKEIHNVNEPILVLKHDVDHTLRPIKKILDIENKYNVSSTFHVRADEVKYSLEDAKQVLLDCDIALHQVHDPFEEKTKIMSYFKNVIGISTHGGHESSIVFDDNFLNSISSEFSYISDGLLKSRKIGFLNKMLLIPIDSADIYFEDPIQKLNITILKKKIMIFNSHVEYFMPSDFLIKELNRIFRI